MFLAWSRVALVHRAGRRWPGSGAKVRRHPQDAPFRQPGQHVDPRGIDPRRRTAGDGGDEQPRHVRPAGRTEQPAVGRARPRDRVAVERGRQGADLPVAPGRQMARRKTLHVGRRQMHLGPADGHRPGQAAHQSAQILVRERREGDDNRRLRGHLPPQAPAAGAAGAARLGLVADLSLPRPGPRDAAAPDRHRAVQVRRVQAERIHQAGEEPGLLEKGPAVSRRHRIHDHEGDGAAQPRLLRRQVRRHSA